MLIHRPLKPPSEGFVRDAEDAEEEMIFMDINTLRTVVLEIKGLVNEL